VTRVLGALVAASFVAAAAGCAATPASTTAPPSPERAAPTATLAPDACRELTAADVAAAIVLMGGWLVVLVAALLFAHSRGLSRLSWLMLGMLRGSALVVVVVLVAGFAVLVKL